MIAWLVLVVVVGLLVAVGALVVLSRRDRVALAEAARLGLDLRIVRDIPLGWDVDVPADLAVLSP